MPRPIRARRIYFDPEITYFKPAGIMLRDLEEVVLTKEELEAIRWIDLEEVGQEKAAKKMKVSQPTLSRILISARKKIAKALIKGYAIRIKGGDFKMAIPRGLGRGMRNRVPVGGGRGRMGGPKAAGPGGNCVCPKCDYKEPQVRGQPCMNKKCPKCGTKMRRE